jgi:MoxR-like ATPase
MLSIHVGYPEREQEIAIAARSPRMQLPEMKAVTAADRFEAFVGAIEEVPVSPHVLEYAVGLVAASRPRGADADEYVRTYVNWGASPRATQHLMMASKACAVLDGRPSPEVRDVRRMALPVLRHRILPNYNALGEGIGSAEIIEHLVGAVGEPVAAG